MNLGFGADVMPAGQHGFILRELREGRLADFFRSLSRGIGDDENRPDFERAFGHDDILTDLFKKTNLLNAINREESGVTSE